MFCKRREGVTAYLISVVLNSEIRQLGLKPSPCRQEIMKSQNLFRCISWLCTADCRSCNWAVIPSAIANNSLK